MCKRLIYLISVVLVLGLAGSVSAADRWSTSSYPGDELIFNDNATWWDNPYPTARDIAFVDGWKVWVMLDEPAQCAQLQVGDWHNMWEPSRFNIYPGADLVINNIYSTGNFELGVKPYQDWGNPAWGNHGWGIVTMTGGNVMVTGNLAVGVQGIGEFYLNGGTIVANSFSMGTPAGPYDYAAAGKANIMDITGGELILPGNVTSLDPRVVAYGGAGWLVFTYYEVPGGDPEKIVNSYTTITGAIPEPATIALLGLGGLALIRRKR